jgi:hypothetical protein
MFQIVYVCSRKMVHPQNVRFQNVRFQNVRFQNVRFQNVRFTKLQVLNFDKLIKQKV